MLLPKKNLAYRGQYNYRQGFAFELPLPDYLAELVDATDAGLRDDDTFMAIADIDLGVGLHKYSIMLDITGMRLYTRFSGEMEETYRPVSMFEVMGGIRDILACLVENGGLPAEVEPNQIHIELA